MGKNHTKIARKLAAEFIADAFYTPERMPGAREFELLEQWTKQITKILDKAYAKGQKANG